jgi:DNA-binding beta-propeller fold protein YncE
MKAGVLALAAMTLVLAAPVVSAQLQPTLGGRPKVAKTEPPPLRLHTPTRATVDPSGQLLVTDYRLRRVCRVASDGRTILGSFKVQGKPSAIGAADTRVFVGLEDERRVAIHAPGGKELGTLGGAGFEIGDPRDLVIDPQLQRLYVIDGLAKEVKVFDITTTEGVLVSVIGGPGTLSSTFQNPTGITLDPGAQEVLVSDFGPMSAGASPRVIVFAYDGTYIKYISGNGGPTGQWFGRPQGLAIGPSGHLFVVDSWRGEVVVMDRDTGDAVAYLGGYGKKPGQMRLPLDVVLLGPDQDLWVTTATNRCVTRYAAGGQL